MTNAVIGVVVLALILYRQRQVRIARRVVRWWLLGAIAVCGIVALARAVQGRSLRAGVVAMLVATMLVGAAMGVWRGRTVRLWCQDGQVFRQGTAQTVTLWVVAIAAHVGLDTIIARTSDIRGLGESSILLYLAVTWGAQGLIVAHRAARVPYAA